MANELTADQRRAHARAELKTWGILALLIALYVGAFLAFGLPGVGMVAVTLVPVIFILLVLMAGGKA